MKRFAFLVTLLLGSSVSFAQYPSDTGQRKRWSPAATSPEKRNASLVPPLGVFIAEKVLERLRVARKRTIAAPACCSPGLGALCSPPGRGAARTRRSARRSGSRDRCAPLRHPQSPESAPHGRW